MTVCISRLTFFVPCKMWVTNWHYMNILLPPPSFISPLPPSSSSSSSPSSPSSSLLLLFLSAVFPSFPSSSFLSPSLNPSLSSIPPPPPHPPLPPSFSPLLLLLSPPPSPLLLLSSPPPLLLPRILCLLPWQVLSPPWGWMWVHCTQPMLRSTPVSHDAAKRVCLIARYMVCTCKQKVYGCHALLFLLQDLFYACRN